jgi:SAM-dependent methyltransferase
MAHPFNIQSTINNQQSTISVCVLVVALSSPALREVAWVDLPPPIQAMLGARGLDPTSFPRYIAEVRARDRARVREGDFDALVYYALQSSAFTRLPPIEPATSAKAFHDGGLIPHAVQDRFKALSGALRSSARDPRLAYFRALVERERASETPLPRLLEEQYARAMRSLYEKEFSSAGDAYQRRGLSTDTSAEVGYAVSLGLAALHALEPQRRIRRVLIVGPGLDLAPRTGMVEGSDPQSTQPFAVIDALVARGLADRTALRVYTLDINPRVTEWLTRMRGERPRLSLVTSVAEGEGVRFSDDYREYFAALGKAVGTEQKITRAGHLSKAIQLAAGMTDAVAATTADIVTDRLDERFDLAVVTNVFPYLSDRDLLLALANIVAMLAPGGVLLHNEPRPLIGEAMHALGLPLLHSRTAVIATVAGATSPLYDAVWLHGIPNS